MASFSVNFICGRGAGIKLNHRVFLIPWISRNTELSCLNGRNYSSSVPVKYISKNASRSQGSEAAYLEENNGLKMNFKRVDISESSPRGYFDIQPKKHGVKDEMDDPFLTSDDELIEVTDEIFEGSSTRGLGILTGKDRQHVEKSAIGLLGKRAYTAVELKKKLQGKKLPLEIVDAVINDFQNRGLINDCLYAESFSRSRWSSSSWGPRRIKQALYKKGVSDGDAEKAIKQVFFENSEEGGEDEDSGISGMSKRSIEQLYVQASKQWLRSHAAPWETRKSRIIQWLQYRGFNWNVIKYILKKLESQSHS